MPQHLPPLLALCAALLAGCEPAAAPPTTPLAAVAPAAVAAPPAPVASAAPTEVAEFRTQRDLCDHFRGEEPYDAKRAAELAQQLDKFCKGTDARLAGLRRKYAAQPGVLDTLKAYEDQVE